MPKYDRELIARMLLGPRVFSPESVAEQAHLLREAENLEADARTVVREVPDGMVLVPKEPTPEMLRAAFPEGWTPFERDMLYGQWESLLSAASGEKGVG